MNDSSDQKLERVMLETGDAPRHAVIWLHGLGADGHDFEPIVPQLASASRRPVRFVFPHAPVRPVTINGGMAMRAWYDILGVDIDRDQDMAGIRASIQAVDGLIDEQEADGIAPGNIVLAGFSQGGAIALRCGLARSEPLAGLIGLSTYLVEADGLPDWAGPDARAMPLFIGHGTQDPIVPVGLGEASARRLRSAGFDVEWQTWPMPHAVCAEEVQAIDGWLEKRLS
ncbi:alpha/beta hydrolase [Wenzhouxiangella sediminis]|uniref:Carboxylesterase n=1 Tax=Wenzhouxiangella sediminis TaxID=1792836 RepID=A0A3E1K5Y9_9GAMM|nr:alpha/beta fold hydrolase [Wenzhouxiangella sediminis]RFF29447.1 carboxylesterase [Wenzhouxiangella sediminis]